MPTTYVLAQCNQTGDILRLIRTYECSDRAEEDKALLEGEAGETCTYQVLEADHIQR